MSSALTGKSDEVFRKIFGCKNYV